ncbi:gastricsin [Clonorchis sinensis]|uniref:Gastricsin n=1 Tax=Clonorchis sinensis TaxID=79923 RepID=H2KV62_CLOSI|nr:gastricsin [Clonorchis sinensis]
MDADKSKVLSLIIRDFVRCHHCLMPIVSDDIVLTRINLNASENSKNFILENDVGMSITRKLASSMSKHIELSTGETLATGVHALLDTGTPLSYLPVHVTNRLYALIGATKLVNRNVVACDRVPSMPTLRFNFGSFELLLEPQQYIFVADHYCIRFHVTDKIEQSNLVFARDSPGTQLNLPFVMFPGN